MGESLGASVHISGKSNGLDLSADFEELSKIIFGSLIAQVSDEDAVGGLTTLLATSESSSLRASSFFSWLGFFNDKGSATEFSTILGNGLLGRFFSGESDETGTLGSAVSTSEEVDVFNSAAVFEEFLDFFS